MRPTIGLTTTYKQEESGPAIGIGTNYLQVIYRAGGLPLLLPPTEDLSEIPALLKQCNAVLFIGGPDIDARRYGMENHPKMNLLAPMHEEFVLRLADEAIHQTSLPVLGICLGCQILNVACGGSLYRDLPSEVPSDIIHSGLTDYPDKRVRHPVTFTDDSPLPRIFDVGSTMTVNSSHHQAVREPGKGLRVIAHAPDSVVEAICGTDSTRFLYGLQWHPEGMLDEPPHLNIFKALVNAAK